MTVSIRIDRTGMTPEALEKLIQFQFISVKDGLQLLGKETRDVMRNIIKTTKHRPAGSRDRLENAIEFYVEDTGTQFVVGVGSKEFLSRTAPYWYIVNYGGMGSEAANGLTLMGNFEGTPPLSQYRGTGVGRQSFFPTSQGGNPMSPKSPIWAMNYIEKTANYVTSIFRVHFSGALKKVKLSGSVARPI